MACIGCVVAGMGTQLNSALRRLLPPLSPTLPFGYVHKQTELLPFAPSSFCGVVMAYSSCVLLLCA